MRSPDRREGAQPVRYPAYIPQIDINRPKPLTSRALDALDRIISTMEQEQTLIVDARGRALNVGDKVRLLIDHIPGLSVERSIHYGFHKGSIHTVVQATPYSNYIQLEGATNSLWGFPSDAVELVVPYTVEEWTID